MNLPLFSHIMHLIELGIYILEMINDGMLKDVKRGEEEWERRRE